ncbi:unnamed protein product [Amaranthus hypochondriacus]
MNIRVSPRKDLSKLTDEINALKLREKLFVPKSTAAGANETLVREVRAGPSSLLGENGKVGMGSNPLHNMTKQNNEATMDNVLGSNTGGAAQNNGEEVLASVGNNRGNTMGLGRVMVCDDGVPNTKVDDLGHEKDNGKVTVCAEGKNGSSSGVLPITQDTCGEMGFEIGSASPSIKKPLKTKKINGRTIRIIPKTGHATSYTSFLDSTGKRKAWDSDVEMEDIDWIQKRSCVGIEGILSGNGSVAKVGEGQPRERQ